MWLPIAWVAAMLAVFAASLFTHRIIDRPGPVSRYLRYRLHIRQVRRSFTADQDSSMASARGRHAAIPPERHGLRWRTVMDAEHGFEHYEKVEWP
ncbi:hypothetical protein [Amycolatopsis nigrescens]|uniref:hypothetical protein n=1 Tax=Amycolatopsis nigrescens TaxID=381445 RepID=UPI000372A0F8|nr:hypothetical protein [Amycolatopsis nigrescens]